MTTEPYNLDGADQHVNPIVAQWLSKAVGDMRTAGRELGVSQYVNADAVCFHAQQAVEKTMKGFLESKGRHPPRVHDLVHLNALVREVFPTWLFSVDELSDLSSAAVEARYPGCSTTLEDATRAYELAVRLWVLLRPHI